MRRTEEFGLSATMEHLWHSAVGPVERGTGFLRVANALSALCPKGSEEARSLDATLLAAPR
jgi:hypothetical protein